MRALGRIHLPQPLPPSAYLVGGAVRDLRWGKRPADLDLVDPHPQLQAQALAQQYGGLAFETDASRQHWRVITPAFTLDLAPLAGSLEQDLGRRDFTLNALAANPRGAVYGTALARHDLQHRILRAVRRRNLWDDPLRSLRAIRLATIHRLRIEARTWQWIGEHAQHLAQGGAKPSPERIQQELNRLMLSPQAVRGWRLMETSGLLAVYLPELARGIPTEQGGLHQHRVWRHSVETLAQLLWLFPQADLALRWGALLHDLGKPACQQPRPTGSGYRFLGHAEVGSQLARERLLRLRYPTGVIRRVCDLIKHHMDRPEGEEKTLRRYLLRHRHRLPQLGWLILADLSSIAGLRQQLPHLQATLQRIEYWRLDQPTPQPLLTGHQIMELLGLEPGPRVGQLRQELLEAQALGLVSSQEEAKIFVRTRAQADPEPRTGPE